MDKGIIVEVAYASVERQFLTACMVDEGATIERAIKQSGVLEAFPELVMADLSVGVFSRRRELGDKVKAGDRIEIYRPLTIDPMEARRLRAKNKA